MRPWRTLAHLFFFVLDFFLELSTFTAQAWPDEEKFQALKNPSKFLDTYTLPLLRDYNQSINWLAIVYKMAVCIWYLFVVSCRKFDMGIILNVISKVKEHLEGSKFGYSKWGGLNHGIEHWRPYKLSIWWVLYAQNVGKQKVVRWMPENRLLVE